MAMRPFRFEASIRIATNADIPALVRLINDAFVVEQFVFEGDRINAEETQAFMDKGAFLIAEGGRGLAGCVYVEISGDRGYLGLLAVEPLRQGTGLGRKLVTVAEDYFREAGCWAVDLRVISQRTPLPPFYRRLGYVEIGTAPFSPALQPKVPGHYIVMSKSLTKSDG
jgi:GNAT superfamily N-acetyltransferase